MKKLNYIKLSYTTIFVVTSLCIWLTLAILSLMRVLDHDQISRNAAIIELIVQILIAYQAIKIYKEIDSSQDKKMIFWFFISNLALFTDDIVFYYFVYIKKIPITSMPFYNFLSYYIPFLFWLGALTIFLSKILLSNILKFKSFIKIVCTFLIANFVVITLFFLSIKGSLSIFSGVTISQEFTCTYKLIMFDMTMLCLICAEDVGIVLLLAGIAILSSGDFLFNYSSVAQVDLAPTSRTPH